MTVPYDKHLGFYLSKPFWAIEEFDIDNNISMFTDLMSEEVFQHLNKEYSLKICRDGMFLLKINEISKKIVNELNVDFLEQINAWSSYLQYANTLVLLFESAFIEEQKLAYFEIQELTNKDAFSVSFENNECKGYTIASLSTAEKFQNARYLSSLPFGGSHPSTNPIFTGRPVVLKSTLDKLVGNFDLIYRNKRLISLFSQLIKSIGEFKIANFDTALIISWFVIESILQDKWTSWINSKNISGINPKRINAERKGKLEGRDYPLSVKLNILELNDLLPNEIFQNLDRIRGYRNKIVHRDSKFKCSLENAKEAINATNDLIIQHFNFKITLNLGLSISGI